MDASFKAATNIFGTAKGTKQGNTSMQCPNLEKSGSKSAPKSQQQSTINYIAWKGQIKVEKITYYYCTFKAKSINLSFLKQIAKHNQMCSLQRLH